MPEDIQKKRERDKKYREKQKQSNKEEFLVRRREICRKSYRKKVDGLSARDRRQFKKKKAVSNRMYREKLKQETQRQNYPPESLLSPKSLSAFMREHNKRKVTLDKLRIDNSNGIIGGYSTKCE
jgi:hypothetical protein